VPWLIEQIEQNYVSLRGGAKMDLA